MADTQRQCACSAFFATDGNLREHLEEYRSREQRLKAELERCRTHFVDGDDDTRDGNDQDQYEDGQQKYGIVTENPTDMIRKRGASKGYFCPSCKRGKPFPKMQGLRRHFQQHVSCEEVCVCCFKVFRFVSEFIRHADKHEGASERKKAYIKKTCDELCVQSEQELALAVSQYRSGALVGQKRSCDMAALDSEILGVQSGFDKPSTTELDNPHFQIDDGSNLPRLDSSRAEPLIPVQSPTSLPQPTTGADINHASGSRDMSLEELYFNPDGGHIQNLDLLHDFDAPILQIMNSIPALATRWMAEDDHTVEISTEPAMYHKQ